MHFVKILLVSCLVGLFAIASIQIAAAKASPSHNIIADGGGPQPKPPMIADAGGPQPKPPTIVDGGGPQPKPPLGSLAPKT